MIFDWKKYLDKYFWENIGANISYTGKDSGLALLQNDKIFDWSYFVIAKNNMDLGLDIADDLAKVNFKMIFLYV